MPKRTIDTNALWIEMEQILARCWGHADSLRATFKRIEERHRALNSGVYVPGQDHPPEETKPE